MRIPASGGPYVLRINNGVMRPEQGDACLQRSRAVFEAYEQGGRIQVQRADDGDVDDDSDDDGIWYEVHAPV